MAEFSLGSGCTPSAPEKVPESGGRVHITLPSLLALSGEESRDNEETFDHWVQRLEKHAELEQWSDRKKILQLELCLQGQAECLFEVLSMYGWCWFAGRNDRISGKGYR